MRVVFESEPDYLYSDSDYFKLFGKFMRAKILSKRTLLIVVFAGLVFFLVLVFLIPKSLTKSDSLFPAKTIIVSPKQEQANFGLPVRLKIPSINVDAAIELVGLTSNGEMDIPKGPANVAWFNLGPHPGNIGSAVIAGHYGVWKNGAPTVFNDLKKLQPGAKISVEDDKGATISFIMRESRSFDPAADASGVFSSNDGKSHLNLVTCESWDSVSESYSKRLVVFTDKE